MLNGQKRVLVAALDWGLGHATRTVPLIRKLQSEGAEVILASSGTAFDFYRSYFPGLTLIKKPGYNIRYFQGIPFMLSLFLQIPFILFTIIREHYWLKKVVGEKKITHVVSDNCYGLWNRKINTVFITHQLSIICPPWLKPVESLLRRIIAYFVLKFNECYVPDFSGENNLSGILSHTKPIPPNVKYIGPLSRFSELKSLAPGEYFDVVILLSGPEPQRSLLEKKCMHILKGKGKICIVRGKPGNITKRLDGNFTIYNHLPDEQLAIILKAARKIVCRSGYSTLMDLHALNLTALLIPTKGQTEQEYLGKYHSNNFETITQDKLSLENINVSSKLFQAL